MPRVRRAEEEPRDAHLVGHCLEELGEQLGLRLQLHDRVLVEVGLENETEEIVRLPR